jgi:hypothetical protein
MSSPKLEPILDKNGRRIHPGIFRRGNRYVVCYRDLRGRGRKRFARTVAEAEDIKAEIRTDKNRGEHREQSRVTFAAYASEWIGTYRGRSSTEIRDATKDNYRRLDADGQPRLDKYGRGACAVGFFGRMRLAEIQPQDVKAYAKQLADRGFAPNTVRLFQGWRRRSGVCAGRRETTSSCSSRRSAGCSSSRTWHGAS